MSDITENTETNDINEINKINNVSTNNFEKQKSHQEINDILEIYMNHELTSGSVFFKPNGTKIWRALENYIKSEYKKRGFCEVITPRLVNCKLYKKSGHFDNYEENMFCVEIKPNQTTQPQPTQPQPTQTIQLTQSNQSDQSNQIDQSNNLEHFESNLFVLPPMNCPGHCLLYGETLRSYKNLPIRLADFGRLHRNETSGAIRGLNRLRGFTQDDAHIFCRYDQISEEIKNCMKFLDDVYNLFGFNYEVFLSTRPDKYMGNIELWIDAEKNLESSLKEMNIPYTINEKDGAFYGPKIDIMLTDSAGRKNQCGTIQLDFQLPQKFDLEYVDYDGKKSTPVMIHRAIFGSIERMMGIILEHFQGKLPLWLSPRQIAIIPLANKKEFIDYCQDFKNILLDCDPLLESIDIFDSADTFSSRIRDAEIKYYNYIFIVGKKEIETKTITYRLINHVRNDIKMEKIENVCKLVTDSYYSKTLN